MSKIYLNFTLIMKVVLIFVVVDMRKTSQPQTFEFTAKENIGIACIIPSPRVFWHAKLYSCTKLTQEQSCLPFCTTLYHYIPFYITLSHSV